jgi:hypothetical protein
VPALARKRNLPVASTETSFGIPGTVIGAPMEVRAPVVGWIENIEIVEPPSTE